MSERQRFLDIAKEVRHSKDPIAFEALEEITSKGRHGSEPGDFVVVATAESSDFHYPMPALKAFEPTEESGEPYWELRLNEEGGVGGRPIVRGSVLAQTILHTGLGGDINIPQQRLHLGKLLMPLDSFYHGPTYGWRPLAEEEYRLAVLKGYEEKTRHIPDSQVVAAADIVRGDGFTIEIPDEPGHFASYGVQERIGSIPITMGDTRRNLANSAIRYINYEPLHVPNRS
jgi:hypothetical protein